MQTLIYNGTIYPDGENKIVSGSILIEKGKIVKFLDSKEVIMLLNNKDINIIDATGLNVLPGFVDIHTHGGVGHDFMEATQEAVDAISLNAVKEGCTSYLASIIPTSVSKGLKLIDELARSRNTENGAIALGIHCEGPYLSTKYHGVMDIRYLRKPDERELDKLMKASSSSIRMMTVAPELENMNVMISKANRMGIACMIGHSAATSSEANNALNFGARGFTHLYNAMSPHLHRNPGCVTSALMRDDAYCELICDGFHIHPDVIKATYKSIGAERIILITDSSIGKGMPDGEFNFSNEKIIKEGIHMTVKDTGTIAGSGIGMIDAVKKMYHYCDCSINEIVMMSSINACSLIEEEHKGALEPGKDGDIAILDDKLNLIKTIIGGKVVYENEKHD